MEGGRAVDVPAPPHEMPIFVRAGTILPLGPPMEYSQQANDPIELRIYTGADGDFTLYQDQGDTYNYEKGAYATIPIRWNESTHKLTIGERKGKYNGMPETLTFQVVFVGTEHGTGIEPARTPESAFTYDGQSQEVAWRGNVAK